MAYAKKGRPDYISESGEEYDLGKVLGIIMSEAEQAKTKIYINNSTIHGSVVAAEEIENSFNDL